MLQKDINKEAVRVALPFNSPLVRAGGYAMLRGSVAVKEGGAMKVNREHLGVKLAYLERIRQLKAEWKPVMEILDANETIVLSDIAAIVDDGLTVGWSTIQHNGALLRILEPALAIRGNPSDQSVQSLHARVAAINSEQCRALFCRRFWRT